MTNKNPFEDLFVLEMANNHWGSVERGLKNRPAHVVRQHPVALLQL